MTGRMKKYCIWSGKAKHIQLVSQPGQSTVTSAPPAAKLHRVLDYNQISRASYALMAIPLVKSLKSN